MTAQVLRERRLGVWVEGHKDSFLIGTTLNPGAVWMMWWRVLVRLCALYYFLAVPVRACFIPFDSMLHPTALCTDLVFDVIVVINVVIIANSAYKNAHSRWVVKRRKIWRRLHVPSIIAAFPLDWFGWACGASNEACGYLAFLIENPPACEVF